jgi:hypothetical protein
MEARVSKARAPFHRHSVMAGLDPRHSGSDEKSSPTVIAGLVPAIHVDAAATAMGVKSSLVQRFRPPPKG